MSTAALPSLPAVTRGTVVTVGTFDGVHRGHHDVLTRLVARATELDRPSVVITFEPHPLEIVNPAAAPPLLTVHDEKLELLAASGIDYLVVLPFTAGLAAFEAERFVDEVLRERYGLAELLVGHDHGFGRGRMGDSDVLRALGADRGFGVNVLAPVHTPEGDAISSTAIRRAIAGGDLARAALGLGRHYGVSGRVVGGDRRGRLLGFPTLNVHPPTDRKLLPPDGVYAVRVHTPTGAFGGMLNLGPRPTFGGTERRIEAHLFDTEGDWYGQTVRVDFLGRLRETRAFDGPDALRNQLAADEVAARELLG